MRYIFRSFITINGKRVYAKTYGKRAFRIPIDNETDGGAEGDRL